MTNEELIAALEAADGPSRKLDAEIARTNDYYEFNDWFFTCDFADALELLPEGAQWFKFRRADGLCHIEVEPNGFAQVFLGVHENEAVAMTLASLRAIAALKAKGEG